MTSKALLTLYTILIVVLVLLLFLLVLALILFRDSLEACCCPGGGRRGRLLADTGRREASGGLRNPAFDAQERTRRLPEQRPFDPMEAVESPPSYQEAVRQELFRFQPPSNTTTSTQAERSGSLTEVAANSDEGHRATTNSFEGNVTADSNLHSVPDATTSLPSTSSGLTVPSSRKRGSILSSCGVASQLSTISEEDCEDWPVTVVIDCIGVQAARLMDNCDTIVSLTNGNELGTQSKC